MSVLAWEERVSVPELIAHLVNLIEKYTELYEKVSTIEKCVVDMVENVAFAAADEAANVAASICCPGLTTAASASVSPKPSPKESAKSATIPALALSRTTSQA